jgi:cyclopropane fatty-acyl-phospholipid synthase-like methyltransferase
MIIDNPDRSWEQYGKNDPYFGVLADNKFRRANLSTDTKAAFFNSGEEYVSQLESTLDHYFGQMPTGRALDFGCGVGRLVMPLARRFESVTGVDVSPSMIQEAERNCREHGIDNASFILSGGDDLPNVSGQFDLINTIIVLQHIPPDRGYKLIRRLLDLVAHGGIIAMHVNLTRHGSALRKTGNLIRRHFLPAHYLLNVLDKRQWNEPLMRMAVYDLNRIMLMLFEQGFHQVAAIPFHEEPHPGVLLMGVKGRK